MSLSDLLEKGGGGGGGAQRPKFSWGDIADDIGAEPKASGSGRGGSGGGSSSNATGTDLPPPEVSGPDEDGVTTTVEWGYNAEGQRVKITRRTRVVRKTRRINRDVARRRALPKFGQCRGLPVGPESGISSIGDPIYLDLTPKAEQKEEPVMDDTAQSLKNLESIVVCRLCKGDHWTLKCPYKDELAGRGIQADQSTSEGGSSLEALANGGSGSGRYVPPSMRGAAGATGDRPRGESMFSDTVSLRATNLSEFMTEDDLREVFSPFGRIQKIYLVRDKYTGESRRFAFIHYYHHADAEDAINAVDGLPYDHLIMSVDFAAPREPR